MEKPLGHKNIYIINELSTLFSEYNHTSATILWEWE